MIVIEGSDLVGKTTVAKRIQELRPHLVYKHLSRPPEDFDFYWDYVEYIAAKNIMDRFILSEPVYRLASNTTSTKLQPTYLTCLQRSMMSVACVNVVLTASPELIKERWGRTEMFDLETVLAANRIFFNVAGNAGRLQFNNNLHFQFHIDCWFHLTENEPFLSEDNIQSIVALHDYICARQAYLKATDGFPIPVQA